MALTVRCTPRPPSPSPSASSMADAGSEASCLSTGEPSLKRHLEPSFQAMSTYLVALTDSHTSLPVALAQAVSGATAHGKAKACCPDLVLSINMSRLH